MGTIKTLFSKDLEKSRRNHSMGISQFSRGEDYNPPYKQHINKKEVYFRDILIIWDWGSRVDTKLPPLVVWMNH